MKQEKSARSEKKDVTEAMVIRGLLYVRGTTIKDWARRNRYEYSTVRLSICGLRQSALAREIRERVRKDVGL